MSASTSERTVRDTAKQFAGQLLVGVFAIVFSAYLNRMLTERELALWPICTSLSGMVAACASFGMGDTFVRRIPAKLAHGQRKEASEELRTGLAINALACLALSVGVYALATILARHMLKDDTQAPLIRNMAFAVFFSAFSERLNWAMLAVQQFGKRSIINVITGVLRTPLAVGLYLALHNVSGMILALTLIPALACVLSLLWLRPYLFTSSGFASPRELISFSLPYYGVSLTSILCGRVNNLLIPLLVQPEALATYFVASSITGYVEALDRFAVFAVTPKLAEKSNKSPESIADVFRQCTRYAFLGLLPIHVLVAVAAAPLLQLYGGHKYADAGAVLVVLSLVLFIETLYNVHRAHIQIFQPPAQLFKVSLAQGAGNIASMVLFVPPLGALGAAIADGVVAVTQMILSGRVLRRDGLLRYDWQAFRIALVGSALAAAALWLMHPLWAAHASPVLAAMAVATIVYVFSLTHRLTPADADLVFHSLPRKLSGSRVGSIVAGGLKRLWVHQSLIAQADDAAK